MKNIPNPMHRGRVYLSSTKGDPRHTRYYCNVRLRRYTEVGARAPGRRAIPRGACSVIESKEKSERCEYQQGSQWLTMAGPKTRKMDDILVIVTLLGHSARRARTYARPRLMSLSSSIGACLDMVIEERECGISFR